MDILYIDVHADTAQGLMNEVAQVDAGCKVRHVGGLREAMEVLNQVTPDAVWLNPDLPGAQSGEVISNLLGLWPGLPVIVLPGRPDKELAKDALMRGAQDVLAREGLQPERLLHATRFAGARNRFNEAEDFGDPMAEAAPATPQDAQYNADQAALRLADHTVGRLSQDLHDTVCQLLAGADLTCAALLRQLEKSGVDGTPAELAGQVRGMIQEGLAQARMLAHGSTVSEERSLVENLKHLVDTMAPSFPKSCEMHVQYPHEDLPHAHQVHLCRIAQEALHNAAKHGQANHAVVRLYGSAAKLIMEVTDDGQGLKGEAGKGGLGLESMRHRAALLGGEARLEPAPEQGTRLHCQVPLGGEKGHEEDLDINIHIPPPIPD